jgi:HD-GYP domain-containing protein (c-di-GMP phosphodiesterase class II)
MGEEVWGAIDIEEVHPDAFDEDDARLVQTAADQIGSALWAGALANGLDQARSAAADALAAAVDARGGRPDCPEALERRALKVGARLGMSEADLRVLRLSARFHDVGKLGLPDEILHKPGKLTPAERRELEEHPLTAERILSPFGFLDDVRKIVRNEHERWDGRGYPDGLRADQIPLGSRVLLATSAYDAMLSGRPYRAARDPREARAELLRCAGTQFDPEVIAAVLEVLAGEDAVQEAVSESSDERQSPSRLAS